MLAPGELSMTQPAPPVQPNTMSKLMTRHVETLCELSAMWIDSSVSERRNQLLPRIGS
jgi:hypothetical protein